MGVLAMMAWTVVLASFLAWLLRWQYQKGQVSTTTAEAAALAAVRRRLERGPAKEEGDGVEGGEEQEEDEQQANDEAGDEEKEKEDRAWASATSSIPDSIREKRLNALQSSRPSTKAKTRTATITPPPTTASLVSNASNTTTRPTHRKSGPENMRSRRQTSLTGPLPLSNPYSAGAVETLSRYPFIQDWLDEMQPALQRIKVLAAEPLPASSSSSFPLASSSSSSIFSSSPPHPAYPLLQRLDRVLANILQYPGAVRYMSFRTDNASFMELWGGGREEGGREGGREGVAGGGQGGGGGVAGGDEGQGRKRGEGMKIATMTVEECCRDILFKLGFKEEREEGEGEGGKEGGEAGDAVGAITLQEVTEAHLEVIIHVLTQLNDIIR